MSQNGRRQLLLKDIEKRGLDTLLVTHLPNVRYLTGFTGTAGVLVFSGGRSIFITDGRYKSQAQEQVKGARVLISKGPALEAAAQQIVRLQAGNVGIEAEHMQVWLRSRLRKMLPAKVKLKETTGLVESIRTIKDSEEVSSIRRAVQLGVDLFEVALKAIRPGVRETEVAAELEYEARKRGAQKMSFETIVASGPRSALPHGVASDARIPSRGFVVLDYGVILGGYCSDMTRTVHVGRPSAEARRMYEAVLDSQLAGIRAVQPGATAGDVDYACRSVLRNTKIGDVGLDRFFIHSTGHGVGLEIHEGPRLARDQKEILRPGMVITIEPGVYVEKAGGVRIEDMVAVTDDGCDVLTSLSKELIIL
ncbi:MAG TPA: Xaa-Pro peptidase family protein [Terriglobales bacterium]|nr:Xaa-Pro peptidase family protein [Terriglobales bacterium]